ETQLAEPITLKGLSDTRSRLARSQSVTPPPSSAAAILLPSGLNVTALTSAPLTARRPADRRSRLLASQRTTPPPLPPKLAPTVVPSGLTATPLTAPSFMMKA